MAKLNPEVIKWAIHRSGLTDEQVLKAFPKLSQWIDGSHPPTFKQLNKFAAKTHVTVRELFADSLPDYALQIADFRTVDDTPTTDPSPELFDTVETMMRRQSWLKGYFISQGYDRVSFVGSYTEMPHDNDTIVALAKDIRRLLGIDEHWAAAFDTVDAALKFFKDRIEAAGVSVVINGVVNDNTHRKLKVDEFRGFVLSDEIAPVIFINGRDVKSAQIFTLAHELCHLAYAQTGVSNMPEDDDSAEGMERFCNAVAAEVLVPKSMLRNAWDSMPGSSYDKTKALARACKVNFIVVARKARDEGIVDGDCYAALWKRYDSERPGPSKKKGKGGDYYNTKRYKLGNVFSDAIFAAVHSNFISYRDAYDLTGMTAPSFSQYFEAPGKADAMLCAEAWESDLTLVTFEVRSNSPNEIKIPDVCDAFDIKCLDGFDFMRAEGFRF